MIIHVCCTVYNLVLIYKLIQLSLSKDSQFFCWYYLFHQRLSFSLHKGFGRNSMIVNHRKYKSKIIFETLIKMYKTINKIMTYIIYLRIIFISDYFLFLWNNKANITNSIFIFISIIYFVLFICFVIYFIVGCF